MNMNAHCAEPASKSNARGAQNAPGRVPAAYRAAPFAQFAPVVASYDDGQLRWGPRVPRDLSSPGSLAPRTLGGDSWKWLFLQPLMSSRE
jgi:phospholipid/cholesterol/gamma-HCH transport system substrate-binding protein